MKCLTDNGFLMIYESAGNGPMIEGYYDRLRVVVYVVSLSVLTWLSKRFN